MEAVATMERLPCYIHCLDPSPALLPSEDDSPAPEINDRDCNPKDTPVAALPQQQPQDQPGDGDGNEDTLTDGEDDADDGDLPEMWQAEHISSPLAYLCVPENDWLFWGPYLSERQWSTVREDYSSDDSCWSYVTYEDAVGHMYMSGEDGLLGVSDRNADLCISMAMWNGKDHIIKERLFGLSGPEGNHGEDVKELYYYLDSLPDHSYMRALYKYPQLPFPYQRLRDENIHRSRDLQEFELTDTGIFDQGGHWDVQVEYTKTDRLGLACHLEVTNCGRHEDTLHLIPQFWLRHILDSEPIPPMPKGTKPQLKACEDGSVRITYHFGQWRLYFFSDPAPTTTTATATSDGSDTPTTTTSDSSDRSSDAPVLLFTNNLSSGQGNDVPRYTKDAFHKFVVEGKEDAVNTDLTGTKCGAYYKLQVAGGHKTSVYWRLENMMNPLRMDFEDLKNHFASKRQETSDYYDRTFAGQTPDERTISIQAFAGLMWSKQYYCFDIKQWIHDPRRKKSHLEHKGRNQDWTHINNHHVLMVPDKWEFPWYAGWDLCISAVLMARYDLDFAKHQMRTFLSDKYMHPRGQLPGCEFQMGDPNPPLQAWAVLQIYQMEGGKDLAFLKSCFNRLSINYTWWNSTEYQATGTFGHGFLGMDNISVIDRSKPYQYHGWPLVQADATGWMGCFALWMLRMVTELSTTDSSYDSLMQRYLHLFINTALAINRPPSDQGLWVEDKGFVCDVFRIPDCPLPVELMSMAGLVPLLACQTIDFSGNPAAIRILRPYMSKYRDFMCPLTTGEVFFTVLPMHRVQRILCRVFDEDQFLAPYGIRSLSKVHKDGYTLRFGHHHELVGETVFYLPGESNSVSFGGNSNWRGPVWIFMNQLLLEALDVWQYRLHMSKRSPSGIWRDLPDLKADLETRLLSIFLPDQQGRRPVHGDVTRYAEDAKWRHLVLFYEFIHADTGRGCGASHQTGWTSAILEIILRLRNKS